MFTSESIFLSSTRASPTEINSMEVVPWDSPVIGRADRGSASRSLEEVTCIHESQSSATRADGVAPAMKIPSRDIRVAHAAGNANARPAAPSRRWNRSGTWRTSNARIRASHPALATEANLSSGLRWSESRARTRLPFTFTCWPAQLRGRARGNIETSELSRGW